MVGGAGAVGGDEEVVSPVGWDLSDGPAEQGDVVGGVVGPGGAGAQLVGEAFATTCSCCVDTASWAGTCAVNTSARD
jgi:hypothetical protein